MPRKDLVKMKYDICSIGHITRDKVVTPSKTVFMSGGTSYYMTYAISRLPRSVSYQLVTKVGRSEMPVVEKIRQASIDTVCYPSRDTVFFENIYGADSNERRQRVLAKSDAFTLEEMKPLDARIFHLGCLLADDFSPEVVEYLASKGTVSIDVQGYLREVVDESVHAVDWKDKRRILACTGILKLNEEETRVITGEQDIREAAKAIAGMGVREVIITLGSYGSTIYADGQFHDIPPYQPSAVVDATGCGDTFSAGYLYCRAQGASYEEAGRFAAAMCSLKLEHSGPFDRDIEAVRRVMGT